MPILFKNLRSADAFYTEYNMQNVEYVRKHIFWQQFLKCGWKNMVMEQRQKHHLWYLRIKKNTIHKGDGAEENKYWDIHWFCLSIWSHKCSFQSIFDLIMKLAPLMRVCVEKKRVQIPTKCCPWSQKIKILFATKKDIGKHIRRFQYGLLSVWQADNIGQALMYT